MHVMARKDDTSPLPLSVLRAPLATATAALAALLGLAAVPAQAAVSAYPSSMGAVGDSITRAFNAGLRPFADSPDRSWATGSDGSVASLYSRAVRRNPRLRGHRLNVAQTGARLADIRRQAGLLRGRKVDYVTVLVGANDLCAPTEGQMTTVAAFREELALALAALRAEAPRARLSVLSIPDVARLYDLGRTSPRARVAWRVFGICASLFARPTSVRPADVARRRRVVERLRAYNAELESACARLPWCTWDRKAVFRYRFEARHVSGRDFFHPSQEGQRVLAALAWEAAFPRAGPLTPAP
jgi:lysophospholipase L1-like esterase